MTTYRHRLIVVLSGGPHDGYREELPDWHPVPPAAWFITDGTGDRGCYELNGEPDQVATHADGSPCHVTYRWVSGHSAACGLPGCRWMISGLDAHQDARTALWLHWVGHALYRGGVTQR